MAEKRRDDLTKRLADISSNRRREQDTLRKEKRHESMKRLRVNNVISSNLTGEYSSGEILKTFNSTLELDTTQLGHATLSKCFQHIVNIGTPSGEEALKLIRQHMCTPNAPIQQIIDAGILPYLILALRSPVESIQSDAVWCLTNIATGDHDQTAHVLKAVPDLLQIIVNGDASLQEQACWAIGNIAGDSDEFRANLILNGALQPLLAFLALSATSETCPNARGQTAAWAISNLSRGSTSTKSFIDSGYIPLLISLAIQGDPVITTEMWWLFYYLTGKEIATVNVLFQNGLADAITLAISKANPANITTVPIVRTLGNLTSGAVDWISELLYRRELLPALGILLTPQHSHKAVLKEALWVASNIFDGNHEHRAAAFHAGFLHNIFAVLQTDQFDLQREAAFAIRNATADCDALFAVLTVGGRSVIQCIVQLLRAIDSDVALACIQILRAVFLISTEPKSSIVEMYTSFNLYEILEELQYGNNPIEVRQAALKLINDVFESESFEIEESEQEQSSESRVLEAGPGIGRGRHLVKPAWLV